MPGAAIALVLLGVLLLGVGITGQVFPLSSVITPTGPAFFDHIVVLAMENQNYGSVLGCGSCAPFLNSMLPTSATVPNFHSYGASGNSVTGCSAGCYTAETAGVTGVNSNCFCTSPNAGNLVNIFDRLSSSGLSWWS